MVAVPAIFFLAGVAKPPGSDRTTSLEEAIPVVVLVALGCCLVAPFRTDRPVLQKVVLAIGTTVLFAGVVAASWFLAVWTLGMGIR
jgi:hypothetical protein